MIARNNMYTGSGFWRFVNNLLKDPLCICKCNYIIRHTLVDYLVLEIDPFNIKSKDIAQFPSKLKQTFLIDTIPMKVRAETLIFTAAWKPQQNEHVFNLKQEEAKKLPKSSQAQHESQRS